MVCIFALLGSFGGGNSIVRFREDGGAESRGDMVNIIETGVGVEDTADTEVATTGEAITFRHIRMIARRIDSTM